MTAIVSSIVRFLLRACSGALGGVISNRCATSPAIERASRIARIAVVLALIPMAELTAQEPAEQPATTSEKPATSAVDVAAFFGGGAVGLAAHESGHLLFDAIFNAHAGLQGVDFHGIPFFAITHDSGLSPRKEFVIDSAGFWVQEATNEWILSRRPNLRHESAPFTKGVVAFNVLASVAYAGAAFARTGPVERDTRGMADARGWKEPYVGLLILAPAVFDTIRYFHPNAKWAVWGSRGAKIFSVTLVFK
jgi:hypothetical protein